MRSLDVFRVGRTFRMDGVSESASQNSPLEWDVVSGWGLWWKMRPGICNRSGMQFPNGAVSGNCIPFQTRIPGHTFRKQRRPHNVAFNLYMFGDTPKTSHAPTSGRLSRRRHIRFIASSARKEGHLMWPSSCAGLSEQGTLYASAWTDVSVVAQQLAAT